MHSDLANCLKGELSEAALAELEIFEFQNGPRSVLNTVQNHDQFLISLRNNHKLLGCAKAFDRHGNMVLINVREMWNEIPWNGQGKNGKTISTDRYMMSKLFLRVITLF